MISLEITLDGKLGFRLRRKQHNPFFFGGGEGEIKIRENDKDLLVGGSPQLVVVGGRVRVHRVEAHGAVDSRAGHGRQLPAAAVAGRGR